MDAMKAKLAVWSKDRRITKRAAIVFGIALILIICLCISISMRANIQKKYTLALNRMQDAVYQNLTTMSELFSRIDDPTVDVPHKLLPEMKARFYTASALNSILLENGRKHAVMTEDQVSAFDAAFEQYITAYRQGTPTGLAKADMLECVEDILPMVIEYNTPANSQEDEVVIINASSGKIQETESENSK